MLPEVIPLARQKKEDGEKAVTKNVSFYPEQYDRLLRYCQMHPYQPSISMVIRRALEMFLDQEEKKL